MIEVLLSEEESFIFSVLGAIGGGHRPEQPPSSLLFSGDPFTLLFHLALVIDTVGTVLVEYLMYAV